jgi:hypothetical protein
MGIQLYSLLLISHNVLLLFFDDDWERYVDQWYGLLSYDDW